MTERVEEIRRRLESPCDCRADRLALCERCNAMPNDLAEMLDLVEYKHDCIEGLHGWRQLLTEVRAALAQAEREREELREQVNALNIGCTLHVQEREEARRIADALYARDREHRAEVARLKRERDWAESHERAAQAEAALARVRAEIAHRLRLIFKDSEIFYKVREVKACLALADELDPDPSSGGRPGG